VEPTCQFSPPFGEVIVISVPNIVKSSSEKSRILLLTTLVIFILKSAPRSSSGGISHGNSPSLNVDAVIVE